MKSRQQIYDAVTNQIIAQLEQGTVSWQKEWVGNAGPFNFKTGKPYRGINYWNLSSYPFNSPAWLTFRQVQQLNLRLKKGSKSATVLFWKLLEVTETETGEKKKVPYPRTYKVFNSEQVEGLEYNPQEYHHEINANCQDIITTFLGRPLIKESTNNGCYYHPLKDEVYMVPKARFTSAEGYYATLFHELIHSTGHSKRLDRALDKEFHNFGDPVYSKEELIAEMGAAQLCAITGISNQTIQNSAAYIQGC